MVFAEIGGAVGADAVLLDAHAVDVEAADDRPAGCPGREARSGDAGLREQQVAERAAPFLRSSSFGTTVTVANWSVTIGSVPTSAGAGAGAGCAGPGCAGAGLAGARRIGLATVTSTCGNAVWARDSCMSTAPMDSTAPHDARIVFRGRRISNLQLNWNDLRPAPSGRGIYARPRKLRPYSVMAQVE